MKIRITKEKVFKILDWLMVPILGSFSYFFITEAWTNFRFGRTNMAIDEIPLQGIPTITMCLDDRKSLRTKWLSFEKIPHEIYFYKLHRTPDQLLTSIQLHEGENHLNHNETIMLKKLKWCYSVTYKAENYDEVHQYDWMVKVVFLKKLAQKGNIY